MGVDCSIIIGKKETSLDRWYVFCQVFPSGKFYPKNIFLAKLKDLINKPFLGEENYCSYWINEAQKLAEKANDDEKIAIINEHDLCHDLSIPD